MFKSNETGIDLLAIDILRGRDVGVPPYYALLEYCERIEVKDWPDLVPYFPTETLFLLQKMYESVFDVDLLTGTLLEKKEETIFYGRVGRCIVSEQFYRFKYGDRFFYSFVLPKSKYELGLFPFFTYLNYAIITNFFLLAVQVHAINELKLSELLCQVTKIEEVPFEAFYTYNNINNPYIKCNNVKPFNFSLWKENTRNK